MLTYISHDELFIPKELNFRDRAKTTGNSKTKQDSAVEVLYVFLVVSAIGKPTNQKIFGV